MLSWQNELIRWKSCHDFHCRKDFPKVPAFWASIAGGTRRGASRNQHANAHSSGRSQSYLMLE